MKYGERLRIARKHAGLSQKELRDKADVATQENISKLERSNAEGSEFTVHYAVACGVRPQWLALEDGEMLGQQDFRDPRLQTAWAVMQRLPHYAIDRAVQEIDSIVKLVEAAAADHAARDRPPAAASTAHRVRKQHGRSK